MPAMERADPATPMLKSGNHDDEADEGVRCWFVRSEDEKSFSVFPIRILGSADRNRTDSGLRKRYRSVQPTARICARASTVREMRLARASRGAPIFQKRFVAWC